MKTLHIIHLGVGHVGSALRDRITAHRLNVERSLGVRLSYCGLFNSKIGLFSRSGLADSVLRSFPSTKRTENPLQAIRVVPSPFILIDTSASADTGDLILAALRRGGYAVMSNKKPLSGAQTTFNDLLAAGGERLLFETTVGAAVPIIETVKTLRLVNDAIYEIQGCMSGTLGFLCSRLDEGVPFSRAVREAKSRGFTEPDPRDDLSGTDVGRKALILARLLGLKLELTDIPTRALYPASMSRLSPEQFLNALPSLDSSFAKRVKRAAAKGKVLRYVASITPKHVRVGLVQVSKGSDIGGLTGPDNIFVLTTRAYRKRPLVLKGPGAGRQVTAIGLLSDILKLAKII